MNISQTVQAALRSPYFWQWTIATAGGALTALTTSQIVVMAAQRLPLLQGPGFGIMLGLSLGVSIGAFQWWVMRQPFSKAYWWIVATGLSTVVSGLIQDSILRNWLDSFWGYLSVSAIATGLLTGLAQWLFLTTRVKKAWVWIPTTVLAQFLSNLVLLVALPRNLNIAPSATTILQTIAFVVAQIMMTGLVLGAVTGIPMSNFIRQKRSPSQSE